MWGKEDHDSFVNQPFSENETHRLLTSTSVEALASSLKNDLRKRTWMTLICQQIVKNLYDGVKLL